MTKVIYFVTPTTIVKIVDKTVEFLPIVGPQLKFTKKIQKITGLTDPVQALSRGIGILFNQCFGKAVAVPAKCVLWFAFLIIGSVTANPIIIAFGAEMGNLILEDFID